MRGAIGEHEGNGLAFLHFEIGDRGQILAVRLHGRAQHGHVLPTDREYRALLGSPDPGNIRAKAEADHQLHLHLDGAPDAAHQPDDIGSIAARWHEVDQCNIAGCSLKPRLENQGIVPVTTGRVGDLVHGGNQPSSITVCAKQGCKTRIRIEGRPAEPIDRPIAADQSRCLAIPDQSIVFDP